MHGASCVTPLEPFQQLGEVDPPRELLQVISGRTEDEDDLQAYTTSVNQLRRSFGLLCSQERHACNVTVLIGPRQSSRTTFRL